MSGRGLDLQRFAAFDIHRDRARYAFISTIVIPESEDYAGVSHPVCIRDPGQFGE
jgi:hypothetical protein